MVGADKLMERALFLGTYPGLSEGMIRHMVSSILNFVLARNQKE
jgi:bacterioferritin (cytochrome b1)